MKSLRLKEKVIVISGGTKGVGRAFAEAAGREGAKVVIGGRDEKAGLEAISQIDTFGSDGLFVHCDLLKSMIAEISLKQHMRNTVRLMGFSIMLALPL